MAAHHADAVGGGGGHHKFFKILMPGSFELSLSIPAKFVAGLGGRRPGRARLTGRGRPSSWDVDLRHDDGGRLSLTGRGWLDFVSANAISAGHMLVFEHLNDDDLGGGSSLLLDLAVELFDASGCCCHADIVDSGLPQQREKYNSSSNGNGCHDEKDNNRRRRCECEPEEEEAAIPCTKRRNVEADETLLCRRIERPYQLRFLDLSKSFCDRVGWSSSRDVVLCVAGGGDISNNNRWQVSVKVTAKSGGMMCTGWAEFATDNGLAISDACVFMPPPQTSDHDVLQVHVLRGRSS